MPAQQSWQQCFNALALKAPSYNTQLLRLRTVCGFEHCITLLVSFLVLLYCFTILPIHDNSQWTPNTVHYLGNKWETKSDCLPALATNIVSDCILLF